jgi:histidinol phosphatase-like PHP family hydrolase
MAINNIVEVAATLRLDMIGITDHLMKEEDFDKLIRVKHDMKTCHDKMRMLYGVEVCEIDRFGSLLLCESNYDELGFDFAIGGIHATHVPRGSTLEQIAEIQHNHQKMMMGNHLIDILAHPWWFDKTEFRNLKLKWPDDMTFIPQEYTVNLAHLSAKTGTAIEVSTMSGLLNKDVSGKFRKQYKEYIELLYKEGAILSPGSDAHKVAELRSIEVAFDLFKEIGVADDRIWKPNRKKKK